MYELIIISALLGLSLGSFANVCIYRLPRNMSVIATRSFCPECKQQLRWFELVPVVSYVASQGKCKHCRANISVIYPIVEILVGIVTVFVVMHSGISLRFIELLFYFVLMLMVAIIDWKHLIIPNQIVIVGLAGGFILKGLEGTSSIVDSLIGLSAAFALILLIRFLGNYIFKKESMGWGDVKLAAVIGLFLGFQDFLISLWLAAIIGSIYGISIQYLKSNPDLSVTESEQTTRLFATLRVTDNNSMQLGSVQKIPFGALLAGASCVVLFLQSFIHPIIDAWLI